MWPQPIFFNSVGAPVEFIGYQEWTTNKLANIVLTYPAGAEVGDLIIITLYDADSSVTVGRMFIPSTPGWCWINCPDFVGTNENTFFGRLQHMLVGRVQAGSGFSLVPGAYVNSFTHGGMYVFKANAVCPIGRQYMQTGNTSTSQVIYSDLSGTSNEREFTAPIAAPPTSANSRAVKLMIPIDNFRSNAWGNAMPAECLGEQAVNLNRLVTPNSTDVGRVGIISYADSPTTKTPAKANWLPYSDGGTAYSSGASAGVWNFVNTYVFSTGANYQPVMTLGAIGTPAPAEKYFYIDVDLPANTRFTWSMHCALSGNAMALRVIDFDTMDLGMKLIQGTGSAIGGGSIIVNGGGGGPNTDPYFSAHSHDEFTVGSFAAGQASISFKTRKAGLHRLQCHIVSSTTSDDYLQTGTTTGTTGRQFGPTTLYEGMSFQNFDHVETTSTSVLKAPAAASQRFTVGWLRAPKSTTGYATTGMRYKSYDVELIGKTDTPKPTVLMYVDRRHTVHFSDDLKSITGGVKAAGNNEPTVFTSNLIARPGFFGAPDKVYFEVNVGTLALPAQGFVIGVAQVPSRNALWDNISAIYTMGGTTRKGVWTYCTATQTIVDNGTELVGAANAQAITPGDVVGVAVDRVNHTIEFFKNGVSVYPAMDISLVQYRFLMVKANAQQGNNSTSIQNLTFNFTGPFQYQPPGFSPHDWWVAPYGTPAAPIVYTSDGTWNKPGGLKGALIIVVGGGGGGGGGGRPSSSLRSGGGGGGGGGRTEKFVLAADLPASVAVTVGTGGTGGTGGDAGGTAGDSGLAGGGSSFGTLAVASGGAGGAGGDQAGGGGGAGGAGFIHGGTGASASTAGTPAPGGSTAGSGCGGGAGGSQNGVAYHPGGAGGSNLQATGGTGGAALIIDDPTPPGGVFGNPGAVGGDGSSTLAPYSAGAGGGGGGSLRINDNPSTGNFSVQAPPGGVGGFPGGGGGGGGAMCFIQNQLGGNGENGGNGVVIVIEYF